MIKISIELVMSTNTLRHLKFSSTIVSFLARSKNITLNPKFNTMSGRSENCTTRMSGKTLDDILYPHIEPHKTGMLQVRFILTAMFLHKPTKKCCDWSNIFIYFSLCLGQFFAYHLLGMLWEHIGNARGRATWWSWRWKPSRL